MAEHHRGTDGLRRHAHQRSDEARRRIDKAIRDRRKRGEPINVNAVARTARVTRKTIYAHPDLLERIRAHTPLHVAPLAPQPRPAAESSIVAALRRQLTTQQTQLSKLRTELKARDEALAAAHGEIARLSNPPR
ncbi:MULTISPECIES: DUF6262 family protein [Mycobacteriaceae]|uniref:Transposase n=2 Tax=Mycobacteroides TaxID=670516 RepID=A0A4R8QUI6_9MYCO|nr:MULTISPECIES: DUF6262 family protein [Mycobacteriaceae]AMT73509.1 hypothetical protein ABG82_02890 [Mycobacteroides immunogenum]ANO06675.1 hypothetical protein BAB75_02895 [Mycobacteroides immunogenum]KIU38758.1 hypothetical protein TL11_20920 [Mycobacteroides immunogenum]KPG08697.1 hypothetical protein AN909_14965 [Mycobacteroides immunogenum]KPG08943.1 hypothetical protein AN910_18270 [Mycobacteroides immunogenum]